jgi:hypothetical protein
MKNAGELLQQAVSGCTCKNLQLFACSRSAYNQSDLTMPGLT